jgi:hypothetical protein
LSYPPENGIISDCSNTPAHDDDDLHVKSHIHLGFETFKNLQGI